MISFADILVCAPPATLNADGQCCGRKPLPYLRSQTFFCPRCDRQYDMQTKIQNGNWAFVKKANCFIPSQSHATAQVMARARDKYTAEGQRGNALTYLLDKVREDFALVYQEFSQS